MTTTNPNQLRVCVFGSSSSKTPQYILDASFKLGQLIAQRDLICVHGGGRFGVMGSLNKGAESCNGRIIGVIHESFLVDTQADHGMVVTRGNDLNERKQVLFDTADCFVVMPGGFGTLDELFDFLCAKGLQMKGITGKPIVLVNLRGYYDGTVQQLQRAETDTLLYAPVASSLHVVDCAEDALQWCIDRCGPTQTTATATAAQIGRSDELRENPETKPATGTATGSGSGSGGWEGNVFGLQFLLGLAVGGALTLAVGLRAYTKRP